MLAEKSAIQEITRILRNIMFCADEAYSARKFRILLYKLNMKSLKKIRECGICYVASQYGACNCYKL